MHERENFTDLHLLQDLWMESFVTLYKCPLDDSQQTNGLIFMSVTVSLTLVKYFDLGVGYRGGCEHYGGATQYSIICMQEDQ